MSYPLTSTAGEWEVWINGARAEKSEKQPANGLFRFSLRPHELVDGGHRKRSGTLRHVPNEFDSWLASDVDRVIMN
jgi:hypothetical protein